MRRNIFDENDEDGMCSQGNIYGIKALGFFFRNPNKETDINNLHKDGFSQRGRPSCVRPRSNSKRKGLKSLPKKLRRQSIRYML